MIKSYPKTKQVTLTGKAKKDLQQAVLIRDSYQCLICGEATDAPPHHIEYRSSGGSDEMDNLATVCSDCHYNVHHGEIGMVLDSAEGFYGIKNVLKYFLKGVLK